MSRRSLQVLVALASIAAPAAADAGHRRHYGHQRHHGHHGHHHRYWSGLSLGFSTLGVPFGYYPPVYYAPAYAAPVAYQTYRGGRGDHGQIETDVRPQSAAVYLDGNPVGIADDFDGWPSKLWVSPGRHQLEFREPGYHPYRVTVEVVPYHSVKVQQRLERGGERGWEPAEPVEPGAARELPPTARDGGRTAALALTVEPVDASVFVDGRSLEGQGRRAIDLAPGTHKLEVVSPGRESFIAELVLRPGQRQELSVRLAPAEQGGVVPY